MLRAVFNDDESPLSAPPASEFLDMPANEIDEWQYQTDNTFLANTAFVMGEGDTRASRAPDLPSMPNKMVAFQSQRAIRQTVDLGSVEEWTVYNMNKVQHPFHIHINPFEVIKVNGEPVEPFWCDTIGLPPNGTPQKPTSITFRTRFTDFRGEFVMHCHILAHEDMGMMQIVDVV